MIEAKKNPITKSKIEDVCRRAGLKPVYAGTVGDYGLGIATGISLAPHNTIRSLGVGPEEYPGGCHVAFWALFKDERFFTGNALIFELFHDPSYDGAAKSQMRINSARHAAEEFVKQLAEVKQKNPWLKQ